MYYSKCFIAEVISRGRITIPYAIRKLLSIKEGDIIEVTISSPKNEQVELVKEVA